LALGRLDHCILTIRRLADAMKRVLHGSDSSFDRHDEGSAREVVARSHPTK